MIDAPISPEDAKATIHTSIRRSVAATAAVARRALAEPWLAAAFHDPKYIPQAHHRLISKEMRRWADNPDSRLMISLPPQVGKSWTAVVWTTFWLLARDPTERIIMASCSSTLAEYHGSHIRERIEQYGAAHGLFIKRGSNRQDFFATTAGGYVRCVGVGGTTTGFPANRFIMDDLFPDWETAMSPTYRDKRYMWASAVARTRLQRGGCIAHVGTRWHRDDVAGRLEREQPGLWRVLKLPALATDSDDPLGRSYGDPLPKPGYDEGDVDGLSREWNNARAEQPGMVWEALYQCNPEPPGGSLIEPAVWDRQMCLDPGAVPIRRVVSLDPSVGHASQLSQSGGVGRQNTFGVVAGWLGDDGRVYISHDKTRVMTPEEGCRMACRLAFDLQANVILIEGNQGGDAWRSLMSSAWDDLVEEDRIDGFLPRLDIRNTHKNKEQRAHMSAAAMYADRVRFTAVLPELRKEWQEWRVGDASPGRIDASGHLILQMLPEYSTKGVGVASPAEAHIQSLTKPWG